ncbi:MarR family winged helix-turn-helix transcriptional regulator [Flindersiella endophytica]
MRHHHRHETPAEEIAALLEGIVRRQRRASQEQLEDLGVTPGQLRVLRTLHHAEGALRVSELAERLGIVPRSATSAIDGLEAVGLVARAPDPGDRRATLVSLTDDGGRILLSVRRRKRDALIAQVERLNDEQRGALLALLRHLAD